MNNQEWQAHIDELLSRHEATMQRQHRRGAQRFAVGVSLVATLLWAGVDLWNPTTLSAAMLAFYAICGWLVLAWLAWRKVP